MSAETALTAFLNQNIPITVAHGIEAMVASHAEVVLKAPFRANENHQNTVFAGSLHTLATLSGWSLLYLNLHEQFSPLEIVLSHSTIDYIKPVLDDFKAATHLPPANKWHKFIKILTKKGLGRVYLTTEIYQGPDLAVHFKGEFAAIQKNQV